MVRRPTATTAAGRHGDGRLLYVLLELLHVALELGPAVLEPADHLDTTRRCHSQCPELTAALARVRLDLIYHQNIRIIEIQLSLQYRRIYI